MQRQVASFDLSSNATTSISYIEHDFADVSPQKVQ